MEPSLYQEAKLVLVSTLGLSKDALHVHAGFIVFFAAVVLLRKPLCAIAPLALVVVAAIAAELLDMREDIISLGYWRWAASIGDITNTVFWPTLVWGLAGLSMLRKGKRPNQALQSTAPKRRGG
ncbi:hypothetical protein QWY84_07770 [Aquisalimonas lutea]|uniref:hypothetical protein n=1 Tax=Aquisalimonas lutea TaxID=1327750 RepID=UPI0025B2C521|nr:hypothetical protein [Aquisalimonas lutea]MDN3517501.1 hypothetical protein [Aquisalimonas lutea]